MNRLFRSQTRAKLGPAVSAGVPLLLLCCCLSDYSSAFKERLSKPATNWLGMVGSNNGDQQQQAAAEEPCGDCAVEKILTEGICREEFLAFDSCYDAAQAAGNDESPCLSLFEKFRACMKNRATVDEVVKGGHGLSTCSKSRSYTVCGSNNAVALPPSGELAQ